METEKDRIRGAYDAFARWYDPAEAVLEAAGLRSLRRKLLSRARGKVLEVGIGTGRNLRWYRAGCEVTGVDLSEGMLTRAARRARRLGIDVELRQMDAEHLDFPEGSFDTVVDALSVCTYSDPVAALREMARVCKPDGHILLLEHGRSDRPWLGRWQDRHEPRHAERLGCHWNREPRALAERAGLEVVEADRRFLGVVHVIEARPGRAAA